MAIGALLVVGWAALAGCGATSANPVVVTVTAQPTASQSAAQQPPGTDTPASGQTEAYEPDSPPPSEPAAPVVRLQNGSYSCDTLADQSVSCAITVQYLNAGHEALNLDLATNSSLNDQYGDQYSMTHYGPDISSVVLNPNFYQEVTWSVRMSSGRHPYLLSFTDPYGSVASLKLRRRGQPAASEDSNVGTGSIG